MPTDDLILEFWELVMNRAELLAQIKSADDPVYDELLEKLQQIDAGLWIEFEPDARELIITADGNSALFDLVEGIVALAPRDSDWQFFALKPKSTFPETVRWESVRIAISDVFATVHFDDDAAECGVVLHVAGLAPDDIEAAHDALLRALDHGLGERGFAELISYIEVVPLRDEGSDSTYVPLHDLESHIRATRPTRH
jgi:hypothetical protein